MGSSVDRVLAAAREAIGHRPGPEELPDLVAAGALVVDIRPEADRARWGPLPGAVVIERNVLEWRLEPGGEHRHPDVPDDDRLVVVVCNEGYASTFAAATLRQLGVNATDLAGGHHAWKAAQP